ncbi:MAG: hypothetical protein IKJ68_04000 [Clostridia bacterium]|nr:hypothetical protein [Clostridia bacterium]
MKKTLKGYLMGVLSTVLLLGCVAYGASTTKTIDVIYDNIKVYKDNVLCETKDANGTVVEPFIYNGTTYMPVRGTANLAGMDVTWDGATKSVYLWDEMVAGDTYFVDVTEPYESYGMDIYRASSGNFFKMSGKSYSNGLTSRWNGAYALFNIDSKYKTLECLIGHSEHNTVSKTVSFIVDGKTVKTVELEAECMPKTVSVPLNYGLQLKIVINNDVHNNLNAVGIANMILK